MPPEIPVLSDLVLLLGRPATAVLFTIITLPVARTVKGLLVRTRSGRFVVEKTEDGCDYVIVDGKQLH
jgi:hypothetical protein